MKKIDIEPKRMFCPQPMYVVGTYNEDNQPNFSVITRIGFAWDGSPNIMFSVDGTKKTKENIQRTGAFSANLVSTDMLWLADYFGCTHGSDGIKNEIEYELTNGNVLNVPVLDSSKWVFECELNKTIELVDSHVIISKIKNIQVAEQFKDMDIQMIDLLQLDPVIYAPFNYFSLGEKLGNCGDWKKYISKLD